MAFVFCHCTYTARKSDVSCWNFTASSPDNVTWSQIMDTSGHNRFNCSVGYKSSHSFAATDKANHELCLVWCTSCCRPVAWLIRLELIKLVLSYSWFLWELSTQEGRNVAWWFPQLIAGWRTCGYCQSESNFCGSRIQVSLVAVLLLVNFY